MTDQERIAVLLANRHKEGMNKGVRVLAEEVARLRIRVDNLLDANNRLVEITRAERRQRYLAEMAELSHRATIFKLTGQLCDALTPKENSRED